MKPEEPGRFQISVGTTKGRLTLVLEGALDGAAAWEVIRRLEACERQAYPVALDLNGVTTIHWLAARILTSSLEYITKTKGGVWLCLPGRSCEMFRAEVLRPDFWTIR